MPTPSLVLTLDIGTGSVRACIYNTRQSRVEAIAARDCIIDHPAPGRAEWDPVSWRRACIDAIREAVAQAGAPAADYLGVTVTSLRQGFVLVDRHGEALMPGVLNYDRRGASAIPEIERAIDDERLYRLCGHWHAPELTLPKLLFIRRQQPALWARVHRLLFVHGWALQWLSGAYVANATMISAGQMADVSRRLWAYDLLASLGIPREILAPVIESGEIVGGLKEDVARDVGLEPGLPVHAGGGDTQFGCLGVGGLHAGAAVIVGGSTTPIMLAIPRPIFDPRRYPWLSPHLVPDLWSIETNAGHTGMIYKWFRDTFGQTQVAEAQRRGLNAYEALNELAAQAPLGAKGLRVVAASPRWAQDTWRRKAPYVIHDFRVDHDLGDVARAILEGVCFGVRGNVEQLERVAGEPFARILFTGGSARVPLWAQMMADVLGRSLEVPQTLEPAARAGAQIVLWGVGGGELPPPETQRYEPDVARAQAYESHYESYLDVFETMQRCFSRAEEP